MKHNICISIYYLIIETKNWKISARESLNIIESLCDEEFELFKTRSSRASTIAYRYVQSPSLNRLDIHKKIDRDKHGKYQNEKFMFNI